MVAGGLFFDGLAQFEDEPVDVDLVDQGKRRVVHVEVGQLGTGHEILELLQMAQVHPKSIHKLTDVALSPFRTAPLSSRSMSSFTWP